MKKLSFSILIIGFCLAILIAILGGYIALDHNPQGEFDDFGHLVFTCYLYACFTMFPFSVAVFILELFFRIKR